MDVDAPAGSESDFSRISGEVSEAASSTFSVVSVGAGVGPPTIPINDRLQPLATLYTRYSTATELRLSVIPPSTQTPGTGRGILVIPGWIRERAAEVLFEGGDLDEYSVPEIVLESLSKASLSQP
jgi:actin-related protein 10